MDCSMSCVSSHDGGEMHLKTSWYYAGIFLTTNSLESCRQLYHQTWQFCKFSDSTLFYPALRVWLVVPMVSCVCAALFWQT